MLEFLGIAPQWTDIRIDEPDVRQAGLVHAVGDVGHAQVIEQLENLSIVLGAVHFHVKESAAGSRQFGVAAPAEPLPSDRCT